MQSLIHLYFSHNAHMQFAFFDFLINMLGFAMPIPVCLWENLPALGVAFLGFIPPVIATVTAIFYVIWYAPQVFTLSHCMSVIDNFLFS